MNRFILLFIALMMCMPVYADIVGDKTIRIIRISFVEDELDGTTGSGNFLLSAEFDTCGNYTIDPPPHNKSYFKSQLKALDNYFRSMSYGKFGLDLIHSTVYPENEDESYVLSNTMNYYHPYGEDDIYEERLTELFIESIHTAFETDGIEFGNDDLVVVIHAGIGQDFALPFLDPTPEDIPSTYVDADMLAQYNNGSISIGNSVIQHGIILPETQNHLLYSIAENMFAGSDTPCEYQFGLTGTFALMVGFAVGLPPLWDPESGQSGIGVFGLMDQGSNNGRGLIPAPPDAWTRIFAGWEEPAVYRAPTTVTLPVRSENNLIQVDINNHEYFLVENRTNWFRSNVSIDSSRYVMYEQSESNRYPPFVEILFDSVNIEKDENGVVTAIPNYDLGLPASGLLIWHIDENQINSGLSTYSVNGNREERGVDLEEADGAQDIGYPNIFMFADPSGGYFGDMWFHGNPEYVSLYPEFEGQPIEFSPYTYPNTKSNNGASTYLSINNIGLPGDTMSFSISNTLLADGFPDTSLHIGLVHDFDGDGLMEIVGGEDSLWVADKNTILSKQTFYIPDGIIYDYSVEIVETSNHSLVINEFLGDSTKISFFDWDANEDNLLYRRDTTISGRNVIIVNYSNGYQFLSTADDKLFAAITTNNDGRLDSLNGISFLSLADLNLDGEIEYLFLDNLRNDIPGFMNRLDVKHLNGTTVSGFPIDSIFMRQTPLIKNLYGDDHPEIVAQNFNKEIVVINWQGEIEYRLTDYGNLVCLSEIDGKNAIITESAIWLFDEVSENYGNEWTSTHHDFGNTRRLHLNIPKRVPEEILFDKAKTYVYPNPAYDGNVTLRIAVESAETVEIMIYDFAGYFVEKFNLTIIEQGRIIEKKWNIDGVESGVYFAKITVSNGKNSDSEILKIGVIK